MKKLMLLAIAGLTVCASCGKDNDGKKEIVSLEGTTWVCASEGYPEGTAYEVFTYEFISSDRIYSTSVGVSPSCNIYDEEEYLSYTYTPPTIRVVWYDDDLSDGKDESGSDNGKIKGDTMTFYDDDGSVNLVFIKQK